MVESNSKSGESLISKDSGKYNKSESSVSHKLSGRRDKASAFLFLAPGLYFIVYTLWSILYIKFGQS